MGARDTRPGISIPATVQRFDDYPERSLIRQGETLTLTVPKDGWQGAGIDLEDPDDVDMILDKKQNTLIIDLDGSGYNVGD